jgi:hypothetical protein
VSASRRHRFRAAVLGAGCAALLSSACRIGQNPALSPAATSPRGIAVQLEWDVRPRPRASEGELLGVDEQGVYVLHPSNLVLYPFGSPIVLRPGKRPPDALDLASASDTEVRDFVHYARYPFGIDERVLRSVLDAIGQDSLVVRRRP